MSVQQSSIEFQLCGETKVTNRRTIVYGTDAQGRSICCTIRGIRLWFEVLVPSHWEDDYSFVESFREHLYNKAPRLEAMPLMAISSKGYRYHGYRFDPASGKRKQETWLRISFNTVKDYQLIRSMLTPRTRRYIARRQKTSRRTIRLREEQALYKHVDPEFGPEYGMLAFDMLRPPFLFHLSKQIVPCGWVQLAQYSVVNEGKNHVDLHVQCSMRDICPLNRDDIAPHKELCFDIETCSNENRFPNSAQPLDAVTMISFWVRSYNQDDESDWQATTLILDTRPNNPYNIYTQRSETKIAAPPLEDGEELARSHVIWCATEAQLLDTFSQQIREKDPAFITGYNIDGYDWGYLFDRYAYYKIMDHLRRNVPAANLARMYDDMKRLATEFAPKLKATEILNSELKERRIAALWKWLNQKLETIFGCKEFNCATSLTRPQLPVCVRAFSCHDTLEQFITAAQYMRQLDDVHWPRGLTASPDEADVHHYFPHFGRSAIPCELELRSLSSAAFGDNIMRAIKTSSMLGRTSVDMFMQVKKKHKLASYSLNNVMEHFFGLKKVDLPYEKMFQLIRSGQYLEKVILYCERDAQLPLLLSTRNHILTFTIQTRRVCRNAVSQQTGTTQQVLQKLAWSAIYNNSPYQWKLNTPFFETERVRYDGAHVFDPEQLGTNTYYDTDTMPFCLDFASLYPNIILSYVTATDTIVTEADAQALCQKGVQVRALEASVRVYRCSTCGLTFNSVAELQEHEKKKRHGPSSYDYESILKTYHFVQSDSIIREMLLDVLAERKAAKKRMKQHKKNGNEFGAMLENAQQLALKVVANSVYGAMGASIGYVACNPVAACVTKKGSDLIQLTAQTAESQEWTVSMLGWQLKAQCKLIYGDTDSVFLIVQRTDGFAQYNQGLSDANKLKLDLLITTKFGVRIAAYITDTVFQEFPHMVLEFEKTYSRFVSIMKKKYAGLKYADDTLLAGLHALENGGDNGGNSDHAYAAASNLNQQLEAITLTGKFSAMGMELKRRDITGCVKKGLNMIVDATLRSDQFRLPRAQAFQAALSALERFSEWFCRQMKVTEYAYFVKTQGLKSSYANPAVHNEANEREKKRILRGLQMGSWTLPGGRVAYCYIKGDKRKKQHQKAETLAWCETQRLKLDLLKYLELTKKPVYNYLRPFCPMLEQGGADYTLLDKLFTRTHTKLSGNQPLTLFLKRRADHCDPPLCTSTRDPPLCTSTREAKCETKSQTECPRKRRKVQHTMANFFKKK